MKLLVDMNLSPLWADYLVRRGHEAIHWSGIGAATADDATILRWAAEHGHVLFTNDLDFGAILSHSSERAPSVVQIRGLDLLPDTVGQSLLLALTNHEAELRAGAILTLDDRTSRVRILPIRSRS